MIKLHRNTSWLAYSTYLYFRLLYSMKNLRDHGKDFCICLDLTCKHPTLPKKTKGKEKMLEARTWAGSKDMGCSPEVDCEDGKEYCLINDGTIMSKICDYLQNDKDSRSKVESPLQVPDTQSLRSEAPVPRGGLVSGRKRCILFTFFQTT